MRMFDIVKMAIHNLRRRPYRSLLNLLGVMLGTVIILLTTAGTNGVKNSLNSLLEGSDFTRKVIATRSKLVNESDIDPSEWRIKEPMSEQKRERLEESLKAYLVQEKQKKDGRYLKIDQTALRNFESIENTQDVVPRLWLRFQLEFGDQKRLAVGEGLSPGAGLGDRVVAGEMLKPEDLDGVLVHELLAYQLGFVTQAELESMIGQEITTVFKTSGKTNTLANFLAYSGEAEAAQAVEKQGEILKAINKLVGDIDLSTLTDQQKEMIRSSLSPEKVNAKPAASQVEKRFKIKGVYHSRGESDFFGLLGRLSFDSSQPLLFHYQAATDIQTDIADQKDFYSATIFVDNYQDLESVESAVQALGYKTTSVREMLVDIEERIDQIAGGIYLVAFVVLCITILAISNTLVISVMERTPEFGIMKSLGAKNQHIVWLMLVEGALLGVVGAVLASGLSVLLGKLGQGLLRSYLEGRTSQAITGDLITLSPVAILIAIVASILICSLASVIPAWRAARLDPVIAMQRN